MVNRFRLSMAALGICALAAIGSGSSSGNSSRGDTSSAADLPPAVAAAVSGAAPASSVIVNANNNFGFRLLTQMRLTDAGKNVFVSPASVALCLEALYNGAAGTTQTAMAKMLGIGKLSTADLNTDNANLQASLVSADPAVQLTIANSFWYHKGANEIRQSFLNAYTKYYGSHLGDIAGAPDNINAWVFAQTNGKITQIADESVKNEVGVLINTSYFRGTWSRPFNPRQTKPSIFTLADGVTTVRCSLMGQGSHFPYYKGDGFQAIQLPYGKQRTAMLVFLPDAGVTVDRIIGEINSTSLTAWLPKFTLQMGGISLPKFTSTYKSDLKPVLSALGMGVAFDPHIANFNNMGRGLYVDTAIHETYLSVDEFGTTAAGGTEIGMSKGGSSHPFNMIVNRPFICAILDKQTGEILFYGAIDSPAV